MIKLLTLRSSMVKGGALGLAYHVQKGLQAIGQDSMVYKIGKKTEKRERVYAGRIVYQNVSIDDFIKLPGSIFIFEPKADGPVDNEVFSWGMELYRQRKATLFLHDIFDTQNPDLLGAVFDRNGQGVFCARPAVLELCGGTRVLLPYWRDTYARVPWGKRTHHAAFMSRISNEKRFRLALDANRLLPKNMQIEFIGAPNRLHVHYMVEKYPELEPLLSSKGYPMDAAVEILSQYKFGVDITRYKGEYGFIQYVTLEAMEAGAIPVLDTIAAGDTLLEEDAFTAETTEELVGILQLPVNTRNAENLWEEYDKILAAHSSIHFAKLLVQEKRI